MQFSSWLCAPSLRAVWHRVEKHCCGVVVTKAGSGWPEDAMQGYSYEQHHQAEVNGVIS